MDHLSLTLGSGFAPADTRIQNLMTASTRIQDRPMNISRETEAAHNAPQEYAREQSAMQPRTIPQLEVDANRQVEVFYRRKNLDTTDFVAVRGMTKVALLRIKYDLAMDAKLSEIEADVLSAIEAYKQEKQAHKGFGGLLGHLRLYP